MAIVDKIVNFIKSVINMLKSYQRLEQLEKKTNNKENFEELNKKVDLLSQKVELLADLMLKSTNSKEKVIIEKVIETSHSGTDKVKKNNVLPKDDEVGFIPSVDISSMKLHTKKKDGIVKTDINEDLDVDSKLETLDKLNLK